MVVGMGMGRIGCLSIVRHVDRTQCDHAAV